MAGCACSARSSQPVVPQAEAHASIASGMTGKAITNRDTAMQNI